MVALADANSVFTDAGMGVFQGLLQHFGVKAIKAFKNAESLEANLRILACLGQFAEGTGY